jgi:ppGpp synthetase/RelA/SpoT-type nucleotidyltranferase
MNLQDYEREFYIRYEEFAETVKGILETAIEASNLPRAQSIQRRAKSLKSLKERLEESGQTTSQNIENNRRDLAGVRIIFYTNTDVDGFLNSRLIFENFDIQRNGTRIHHPTKENEERRYRAIHYTVRLKDDRAKLPEYSKFRGMLCEIQVQTILNHAWSETSHDIVYKNKPQQGFGSTAMESITNRLNRIMDRYLLPAGYEFQRIQHDYQRLQQGKELFEKNVLGMIQTANDNNERHELLTSLKEHVLPNYDDLPAIYRDLIDPLTSVAIAAKTTPTKPVETPFGEFPGKTSTDVARLVVEIFDTLRYVDVERTFDALCQFFRSEADEKVREQILGAAKRLARYDISVWEAAGPTVQSSLVEASTRLKGLDRESVRSLIVAVYGAVLHSEITGTTWKASSVTMSTGSVPVSPIIKAIRDKTISGLFELFLCATSDAQRREVISALHEATRPSSPAQNSNDLLKLTLTDATRIVDFLTRQADELSYELKQSLEHSYYFEYRHARNVAEDKDDRFGCRTVARGLMRSIIQLRDRINADQNYVRYKTLVGYEIVFADHWDAQDLDFAKVEEFRSSEVERFVEDVTMESESEWFAFIERCATTKSNDLATFPVFAKFLNSLAWRKPDIVKRLLASASNDLLMFLPALLNGLFQSASKDIYQECFDSHLEKGTHLTSLMLHWRVSKPVRPDALKKILNNAIAVADDTAVSECLLFAIEGAGADGVPVCDEFFRPALLYLNSRKNARWARSFWFARKAKPFFDSIAADDARLLLENLLEIPRIEFQTEEVMIEIARRHLPLVWEYFGQRLRNRSERKEEKGYEAVPYQFHGLEKELSKDAKLAVSTMRGCYEEDSSLFRFLGGRLLSNAFPMLQEDISQELVSLVTKGTETDADFVLAVMENYHGEPSTHQVLKHIVVKYPEDESKLTGVRISLDNTGVVTGEFGLVEAMRQKKEVIAVWLDDPLPEVRAFAAKHTRDLDLRIADEQRRAEEEKALRELRFEKD